MADALRSKLDSGEFKSHEGRSFIEQEIEFSGRFSGNVFQTIGQSFAPYKYRVMILMVVGVAGRLCLLSSANVLGYWADSLCQGSHCASVPAYFEGMGHFDFARLLSWIVVIGFAINTLFRVAISRTGSRAVSLLYDEVTMRTSRLPMSFFDATPVGRIISRFGSDYGAIFRMAGGPLGEFLCLVFDLAVMIILTTVASIWFVPVVFTIIVLNIFAYRLNNPKLRRERRETSRVRGPAIAHFAETVQGTSPIKVYAKTATFKQRFSELIHTLLIQRMRTAIAVNIYSLQMTSITAIVLLATGLMGISLIEKGLVSVGSLAVAFTFIMMTSTTIQQFFEWLANLEEALTGIERLDNYLRRPLEPGLLLPQSSVFDVGQAKERGSGHGRFSNASEILGKVSVADLSMRYREDLPFVLDGISFVVKPGEHFAIVGRTGSGKSSLIQALFGLYPISRGEVSIGGYSADIGQGGKNTLPVRDFRKLLALIPQEPILFRGTIRDNLWLGDDDGNSYDQKIWRTLREVGIDQWVSSLQSQRGQGLDYFIEERGTNLSSGERQLLCMARAILLNAQVIIMDEATSAIDPHAEELLMRTMRSVLASKTRIVIAHRLSTVVECDRILWLDRGKIKMLDTSDRVLKAFSAEDLA